MPNRLLTPEEQRNAFDRAEDSWKEDGRKDIWEFSTLWEYIADEVRKAQDAKTLKAVGEGLDIEFIINMLKQAQGLIWQKKGRNICKEQIRKLEVLKERCQNEPRPKPF